MLTLTENAVTAIRGLTGGEPEQAGLRIATSPTAGALTMNLAPTPDAGDQVVDEQGARLFLDPGAASVLDDKELDAAMTEQGAVEFAVRERDG